MSVGGGLDDLWIAVDATRFCRCSGRCKGGSAGLAFVFRASTDGRDSLAGA